MRKVLLTFLILAVVFSCLACPSLAGAKYSGGTGEPNTPYQIATKADLLVLANDANDYNKCFSMTADIDLDPNLPGGQVFTAAIIALDTVAGNSSFDGTAFTGTFDGNGHKITGFTINGGSNWYLGLFGRIAGGSVKNLGFENCSVSVGSDGDFVGGLVGYNQNGSIENCYSMGEVNGSGYYVGGLVGYNRGGSISNCYSTGTVSGSSCVGGLVGGNESSISNCYSTGQVTGAVSGSTSVGGLVGYSSGGSISNCYATGSVTGENAVGGLVGGNDSGSISHCYSTGTVSGSSGSQLIGGLVGYNDGSISRCYSTGMVSGSSDVGGLVGDNYNGSISDCYSTGAVSGSSYVGGLVGISGGSIDNCYSTGAVSGSSYVGGLVGHNSYSSISNCYSTGPVSGYSGSVGVGGLVGYNYHGSISNCYSTGTVSGSSWVGGLVGGNGSGSSIINCYSTGTVSGNSQFGSLVGYNSGSINSSYFLITSGPANGYGTPLTDTQMKQQASFVGWEFNDVWHICEAINYPKLKWQILPGDIVCPDGVDFEDLAELCYQWLFEEIPADLVPPGGDGIVDFADFAIFANQWGTTNNIDELLDFTEQWLETGLPVCSADISPLPDGDGRVDAADFALMANNWLQGF